MPLSDPAIKKAKPTDKPYKLADEKGLFLLVNQAGKYWRLAYRFGGKQKTLALGVYPDVPLSRAREKRDEARKLIADDIDPGELRKATKTQRAERAANSFEAIAREWFAKAYADRADSTREKTMTRMEQDVFPVIGAMPISRVESAHVLNVIERIAQRDAVDTAKRVFNYVGRVLRYADSRGLVARDVSASIDLKLILTRRETAHHAALTDPLAVGGLMRAIDSFTGSFTTLCALKMSALSFVRPGELRHAEWTEFDLDGATWNIPGSKMKMKSDHIVPLSTQAVAILRELHAVTGSDRYVFQSERGKSAVMSENTINAALRRLGYPKEEMTAHGFRAMARTILDEVLNFRPDFIEHQLAHAVKDPNGRAYNRTAHLAERRKMMQQWADYLDKLKAGAEVIPLHRNA
ncbi:tyrosine-type recombinase/integrase [Thiobacillus thioparus]|uniref:tyrosine-type recombinase/integrase n=1 Tax=Thiobacillus thioparus TaxID=931 RepID=UPI0003A8E026|nr:integrase arm-type DNA-binding domain-containing protein [Thiobacillus thioparus]